MVVGEDFRVIRFLGKGGMGSVYLAEELTLRRNCALKVVTLSPGDNTALPIQRFLREAQLMAGIRHPAVVQVLRYGIDPATGLPFYAMPDYLLSPVQVTAVCRERFACAAPRFEGKNQADSRPLTLADILNGNRALSETVVARIGLELLTAMQAIHGQQPPIIHRDIKPSNLLINSDGQILLSDFGIARTSSRKADDQTLTLTGVIPGTPQFCSPEQRTGGSLTIASDYYSFGLVLFRALTGGLPSADFPELPTEAKKKLAPEWRELFRGLLDQKHGQRLTCPDRIRALLRKIEHRVTKRNNLFRQSKFLLRVATILLVLTGIGSGIHFLQDRKVKRSSGKINKHVAIPALRQPFVWLDEQGAELSKMLEDYGTVVISNSAIVVRELKPGQSAAPAIASLDQTIAFYGRSLGKSGKLPQPEKNKKGELVYRITDGAAISLLDCDFPANSRLLFDNGTLFFAPPEVQLRHYIDALLAHRAGLLNGTILPASPLPPEPAAAQEHMECRIPITIGTGGAVFEDVFDLHRIYMRSEVIPLEGVSLPPLKLNAGLCHFHFASLPIGLRIDGSYSASVEGRTEYFGDDYPGQITQH